MRRSSVPLVALFVLAGCASTGTADSERRYVGVVERVQSIARAGNASAGLLSLGLAGGLLHAAANQPTQTNLYIVRLPGDRTLTAQADQEFKVGACVEVVPSQDAPAGLAFMYGQARVGASLSC